MNTCMKFVSGLTAALVSVSSQAALLISDDFSVSSTKAEDTSVNGTGVYSANVTVGSVQRSVGTSLQSGTYSSAIVNGDLLFSGDASVQSSASYDIVYTGASLTGTTGTVSFVIPNANFGSDPANVNLLVGATAQLYSGASVVSSAFNFSSANSRPISASLAVTSALSAAGLTVRVSSAGRGFDIAVDNLQYSSVPAPATALLLGMGLIGLGLARRRG